MALIFQIKNHSEPAAFLRPPSQFKLWFYKKFFTSFWKYINNCGFFSTFLSHFEPLKFLLILTIFLKNFSPNYFATFSINHVGI